MTIVQEGFRWRYDDGNEANATWRAAQDSNITLPLNTPVRLRTILDVAANPSPAASYYRLEFKEANETTYTAVAVGGNKAVTMSVSGNIASGGEASTVQLIAPSGKTSANFAVGRVWDDENGLDAITIGDGKYTELEWCVTCNGSVAAIGNVFSFRATRKDLLGQITLNALTTAGNATDCERTTGTAAITLTGITIVAGNNRGLVVEISWGTVPAPTIPNLVVTALVGGVPTAMTQKIIRITATLATALYYIANPDVGAQSIVASWDSYFLDTYLSAACYNNVGSVVDADTQGADAATLTMTSDPNGVTITAITTNASDPVPSKTLIYAESSFNPGGAADYALGGTSNVHTYTNIGTQQVMVGIHLLAA